MTIISADERAAMRESFRRLLAEKCAETDIRRVMASPGGHDADLWQAMADLGIVSLLVPEEFDGIGAGAVEMEEIMEEAGAALLAGPLLPSAFIAASLVSLSDDADAKARLLPSIASGQTIATVAFIGDTGTWSLTEISVTARPQGNVWVLEGEASFLLSANLADVLLVFARTPDGVGCFEVDPSKVQISPLVSWDPSLRMSKIALSETQAVRIAGVDSTTFEQLIEIAVVALAGEQAGACRRIFDITVEYLKTRVQFGRPIGGFQAIKHMAADLLIEVESATSAARSAALALATDAPDKDVLISLAAFACADAFSQVAAASIQMHGGIAFTWEHPAHLYLRRARADAQLFGQSDAYRERFVAAMEKAA